MKRALLLSLAALVALGLAFTVGRKTAPTREVERVRTVGVAKSVVAEQRREEERRAEQATVIVRRVVVREQRPDGSKTETITEDGRTDTASKAESAKATVKVETRVEYRDRLVETIKERPAPLPRWSIGAGAGLGLDGRPEAMGSVGLRLVGPIWVEVGATTGRAIFVGGRFTW